MTEEQWYDWKWQTRHRIRTPKQLREAVRLNDSEELGADTAIEYFPLGITPYYFSLMNLDDPNDPIRLQSIPRFEETVIRDEEAADPLAEDVDSPVPGVTHRYPDRVLFLITDFCAHYCRHCTRRRMVGSSPDTPNRGRIARGIEYIREHEEIRDVLLSGGDPFTLSDSRLDEILTELRTIPHVEIIRFGTRIPVVLPMRVTEGLCKVLEKHHPVYVNTHFNHPNELTDDAAKACDMLSRAGVPIQNQSVLLKGINDDPKVMLKLVHGLLKIRVRPYYLYQCDLSPGLAHFRTPISRGMEIMELLRGHTTGFAVPTYVVDAPGGGGKIPVMPQYLISQAPGRAILRNYEGMIVSYPDPTGEPDTDLPQKGIGKLLSGEADALVPEGTPRLERRKQLSEQKDAPVSSPLD